MAMTPNDITNKEFRKTLRGYDADQVNDFLQAVSDSLLQSVAENQRLKTQADDLRARLQRFQETEDLLSNALILAERAADETRQRAHQEADLIRREAEQQLTQQRASVEELRQIRLRFIAELRAMLQAHLAMLEAQDGSLANFMRGEEIQRDKR